EHDLAVGVERRVGEVLAVAEHSARMLVRATVVPVGAGIALGAVGIVDLAVLGVAVLALARVEPRIPDVLRAADRARQVDVLLVLVAEAALEPDIAAATRLLARQARRRGILLLEVLEQRVDVAAGVGVVAGGL